MKHRTLSGLVVVAIFSGTVGYGCMTTTADPVPADELNLIAAEGSANERTGEAPEPVTSAGPSSTFRRRLRGRERWEATAPSLVGQRPTGMAGPASIDFPGGWSCPPTRGMTMLAALPGKKTILLAPGFPMWFCPVPPVLAGVHAGVETGEGWKTGEG